MWERAVMSEAKGKRPAARTRQTKMPEGRGHPGAVGHVNQGPEEKGRGSKRGSGQVSTRRLHRSTNRSREREGANALGGANGPFAFMVF